MTDPEPLFPPPLDQKVPEELRPHDEHKPIKPELPKPPDDINPPQPPELPKPTFPPAPGPLFKF